MSWGFLRLFQRRHAAGWTLAAGLAVTAAIGWEMHREAVAMDRQRLALRAGEIQSQLDSRLEKSEMLLQNLRDYLSLSGENRSAVLNRWSHNHGLTINCPWIHGLLVATNRHTFRWRDQFPNPPGTWNSEDWERLRNFASKQPIDCEIASKTSITNSKQYLDDYQLRSFGHGQDRFAAVVKNSRLGMSERRDVIATLTNWMVGTLFYVPIYSPEAVSLLAEAEAVQPGKWGVHAWLRWLHFRSMIVAPVDFDALVEAIQNGVPADLGIELFSSTNQTTGTWLSEGGNPRAADPAFKAYLTHRQTWPMYGERFSIFFYTTPLFEAQSPRRLARIAVASGIALTLLATALVGVVQRARDRQESLTDQIREARDALAAAQKERNQISRDLHDGTIQSLYAIQLGLEQTAGRQAAEPATAGRELRAVRRELDAVIAEIRQFITAETKTDGAVDFRSVLESLAQRARAGTTTRIELNCDADAARGLAGEQAVQLANIVREAFSNSLRHARAGVIRLNLRQEADAAVLEVVDDGCGFDPQAQARIGVGLGSMASRANEMGGEFSLRSAPGKGTRINVRLSRQAGKEWATDAKPT